MAIYFSKSGQIGRVVVEKYRLDTQWDGLDSAPVRTGLENDWGRYFRHSLSVKSGQNAFGLKLADLGLLHIEKMDTQVKFGLNFFQVKPSESNNN